MLCSSGSQTMLDLSSGASKYEKDSCKVKKPI